MRAIERAAGAGAGQGLLVSSARPVFRFSELATILRGRFMTTRQAFIAGYQLAKAKRRDFSKRELETLFPKLSASEIDAMSNGVDDALVGDSFRYKLAKGSSS